MAQTKEHGFQARSAGEWARLRRVQGELEAETGNAAFLGLSLAATLAQCVRLGNHRAAARLRADFKVSDRRFWWLKARAPAALLVEQSSQSLTDVGGLEDSSRRFWWLKARAPAAFLERVCDRLELNPKPSCMPNIKSLTSAACESARHACCSWSCLARQQYESHPATGLNFVRLKFTAPAWCHEHCAWMGHWC